MSEYLSSTAQQTLQRLRTALSSPDRPGRAAQLRLCPPARHLPESHESRGTRQAAVMALLYPVAQQLTLLFIQRTSPPHDRHAGQIAFPGGATEAGDADYRATALRELMEEVAIPSNTIEVLGALTPLYIPVSDFMVHPFVGFRMTRPVLRPEPAEVARVIEIPLNDFLHEEALQRGIRRLSSGIEMPDVPYWAVEGEQIWGATSMIVAELIALLEEKGR